MPREGVLWHTQEHFHPGLDGTVAFIKTSSKLSASPLGPATTCEEETALPMAPLAKVTSLIIKFMMRNNSGVQHSLTHPSPKMGCAQETVGSFVSRTLLICGANRLTQLSGTRPD